jgi:hypothetical protein
MSSLLLPPYKLETDESGKKTVVIWPYADKCQPNLCQLMIIASRVFPDVSSPNDLIIMPGYMSLEITSKAQESKAGSDA